MTCETPGGDALPALAAHLSAWQGEPWPGHLHPGDLGWHSLAGAEQTAADLRVWRRDGEPAAVGLIDGGDVFRLAVDPVLADDAALARRIAADLATVAAGGELIVEARGARALRAELTAEGWVEDEPWTPLVLDLSDDLDLSRCAGVRVEQVGPDAAQVWTGVHWSAFTGTAFEGEAREQAVARWVTMMSGPCSDRASSLVAYDAAGEPVAVTTVWFAGRGRPGLVEPLGVHRDHHGHGYGVAITLAGAQVLQRRGASAAVVVAENANLAALHTYLSAGFVALEAEPDLRRA